MACFTKKRRRSRLDVTSRPPFFLFEVERGALLLTVAVLLLLALMIKWQFEGGESGSALARKRGEQRAYAGDAVFDEMLGEAKLISRGSSNAFLQIEVDTLGNKEVVPRTASNIYVVVQRAERSLGGMGTLEAFMRNKDSPAATAATAPAAGLGKRKRPANGKALGRHVAGGQRAAAATPPIAAAPATPNAAADGTPSPPPNGGALALLGSAYAESESSDDDDAAAPGAKRAKAGNVTFRSLDADAKAEYRHARYEARKANTSKQDVIVAPYVHSLQQPEGWLAKDAVRGWHCRLCFGKTIKPQDKLSNQGYGWTGSGEACVLNPVPSAQKLTEHVEKSQHRLQVEHAGQLAKGKSHAAVTGDATVYFTVTPEDELYARTIRTVHTIVIQQLPLHDMHALLLLQQANGAVISFDHMARNGEGGLADWLEAGKRVLKALQRDKVQNSIMISLFPKGGPLGLLGDGSTDRAMYEQEAVVTRHLSPIGKPFNAFHDLAELDLKQSADGRSPDAMCITECYAGSVDQLNVHEGYLFNSNWRYALVGTSFDGASVMLGNQNGVVKRLRDKLLPEGRHMVSIHACAHVEQLGNADAFAECDYYEPWKLTMQELYCVYNGSGKKRFSLEEIANELDAVLLKLSSSHGIRWAAAQAKTIRAVLADLAVVAADLEVMVKSEKGAAFTLLTPSENFINKKFKQSFGPRSIWTATVVSFTHTEGSSAYDKFTLRYSNKTTMEMGKAELVELLTDAEACGLTDDPRWQLRGKVIEYRFIAFTAFMLDTHEQLAILSKSFQSNSLIVFDISKNVNKTLAQLKKLTDRPGQHEQILISKLDENDGANMYHTCQIVGRDEGELLVKEDRKTVLDALDRHFISRFQKVLDDPVLKAMSIFDHRYWPGDNDALKASYTAELELLYKSYIHFFDEGETLEDVRQQFETMVVEINSAPGLMATKFHDLWARILVQFSDEYNLVLRLVVISLLVPADTSECERIFSLMNNIKTADRATMGQQKLKNLMLWHEMGKELTPQEVPVMAILKEFREMAGPRGRTAHRPAQPSTYEYEKHRFDPSKGASSSTM